jgi:hypothetical protein
MRTDLRELAGPFSTAVLENEADVCRSSEKPDHELNFCSEFLELGKIGGRL